MQNHVVKYLYHHTKHCNNNDDITNVSDLTYDEMCINLN